MLLTFDWSSKWVINCVTTFEYFELKMSKSQNIGQLDINLPNYHFLSLFYNNKNNTNREDNHQQANWTSVSQGRLAVRCFLLWMPLGPATRPPRWVVQRGDPYGQVWWPCLSWGPCVRPSTPPLHYWLNNPRYRELLVPCFYQGSFSCSQIT